MSTKRRHAGPWTRSGIRWMALLAALVLPLSAWAKVPPFDRQLPAKTLAYVSLADMERTEAAFRDSDLGKILAEPGMKAFLETLEKGLEGPLAGAREQVKKETGFSLDELLSLRLRSLGVALLDLNLEQVKAQARRQKA